MGNGALQSSGTWNMLAGLSFGVRHGHEKLEMAFAVISIHLVCVCVYSYLGSKDSTHGVRLVQQAP